MNAQIRRQLYVLSSRRFESPDFVDETGALITRPGGDIPLIFWPNGRWCAPANTFMRELFERGLSRRNRGGSLAIAASHISHLIRYCWDRRKYFDALTDNDFRAFVGLLLSEAHFRRPGQKARSPDSVIRIGRSCLQFLDCFARQCDSRHLLGADGQIRAELKEYQIRLPGRGASRSRTKTVHYWYHPAFPEPSALKRRGPISTANIERIREGIGAHSKTPHQRMRRHTTIKLLEITGSRRGEVALITVASVIQASRMEVPMLRVPTLKKRADDPPYRYVPVSRSDIAFILQYVDVYRRAIVRRKLKGIPDHGVLLVSGTTGEPYSPTSITKEIRRIARLAGIGEKACPHMFRHRFITKLFVALIEQHAAENPDQFRRMLLDGEALKCKVMEWTGQANVETLDRYIDLAFDEVANYKRMYDLVSASVALDSFRGSFQAIAQALSSGESPAQVVERALALISAMERDLQSRKRSESEETMPRESRR